MLIGRKYEIFSITGDTNLVTRNVRHKGQKFCKGKEHFQILECYFQDSQNAGTFQIDIAIILRTAPHKRLLSYHCNLKQGYHTMYLFHSHSYILLCWLINYA